METHPVQLTGLSPAQMSRLRNGHACRCGLGSKGEGVSAHLGIDNIKKLMKAGRKGAKATVSLAKEEIDANQMHGTGLVAGGRIKRRHIGHILKKVGKSPVVQALKKEALSEGSAMAKTALMDAGVPPSVANAAVNAGSKKLDKATGGKIRLKHAASKLLHSKPVQQLKKQGIEKGRKMFEERAQEELEKRGVPPGLARAAAKQGSKFGASQLDEATGGRLSHRFAQGGRLSHRFAQGGAIGMMDRRVESVGAGGNLLHRHPSQMSQADSANFHFHTQFPPGLAEVRGSGLYGSGLYGSGLYV